MGWNSNQDLKIDPSGIKQDFTSLNIKLHCCRYWKFSKWELTNLSFPFWRFYYNSISGASIKYKNKVVHLDKSKVILIPPYTSFSTYFKYTQPEGISGNRISSTAELDTLQNLDMIDHLFIHFNLGFQYDYIVPNLYVFDVDEVLNSELFTIRHQIIKSYQTINYSESLKIYALIIKLLSKIDHTAWIGRENDSRVIKVIEHIETNFALNMSNDDLANIASMACNSFLRLFKEATGTTIQRYIQGVRINKAILEMHNSQDSIESIAAKCGFSDRHHFSKVFKRNVGMSPGQYRQLKIYK